MDSTQPFAHDRAPIRRFAAGAAAGDIVTGSGGAGRTTRRLLLLTCAAVALAWLFAFGLEAWMRTSFGRVSQDTGVVLDLDDASAPGNLPPSSLRSPPPKGARPPWGGPAAGEPAPARLELRGRALVENAVEVTQTDHAGSTLTTHLLIPIVDQRWTQGEVVAWLLRVPAAAADELRRSPGGPWHVRVEGRVPLRLAQALRLRGVPIEASARLLELAPSPAAAR